MKLTRFVLTTLAADAIVLTVSAAETKEPHQVREIITKVNNKWQADHPFWTDAQQPWTSKKAWGGKPFPKDHRWGEEGKIKDLF